MQTIKSLLDKIKWDPNESPKDYSVAYLDRIQNKLIRIPYLNIKRIEEGLMFIDIKYIETCIPLHRIKIVKKKGRTIWQRKQ